MLKFLKHLQNTIRNVKLSQQFQDIRSNTKISCISTCSNEKYENKIKKIIYNNIKRNKILFVSDLGGNLLICFFSPKILIATLQAFSMSFSMTSSESFQGVSKVFMQVGFLVCFYWDICKLFTLTPPSFTPFTPTHTHPGKPL